MKPVFFTLFVLLCCGAQAQTWQWAKSAGSAGQDFTRDITVDAKGNIYMICGINTSAANPTLAGHAVTGFGGTDIAVLALRCDGTYRWSKIIGSNGSNDNATSIITDNNGNVYVDMDFDYGIYTAHIGTDTVFQTTLARRVYLVSFDSAGNYRWAHTPVKTLMSNGVAYCDPTDLTRDKNGNIAWLCNMTDSMVIQDVQDTTHVSGFELLTYSPAGLITDATPIDLHSYYFPSLQMAFTRNDNRIILTGTGFYGGIQAGSVPVYHSGFALCYNRQGQLLWAKQNGDLNTAGTGFPGKPIVDTANNIYIAGVELPNDTFNGTYINYTVGGRVPFVSKLDSDGHKIWAIYAVDSFGGPDVFGSLTMRNPFELVLGGNYYGTFSWSSDPAERFYGSGTSNAFLTRIRASDGWVLHTDTTAHTANSSVKTTAITSNGKGSIFTTGNFVDSFSVQGNVLHGTNDIYIASDGFPGCSCTLPNVDFNMDVYTNPDSIVLAFPAYAQADSFIWEFGTGTFSVLPNVSYTYINGFRDYHVCLTAWNGCGFNISCKDLSHVGIENLMMNGARIYPNPVTDILRIEMLTNVSGCNYSISSLTGQQLLSGQVYSGNNQISLAALPPGVYMVVLKNNAGERSVTRIVKE